MIDTYMMWVNLGRTVTPTWCGQTYIGLRHLHGVGKLRYDCNTYMVWANLGRTDTYMVWANLGKTDTYMMWANLGMTVTPTWCGQT